MPENKEVPVALMQLSSHSGECLLVRLCKVNEILPKITNILENVNIIKVGVGILGDAIRVRQKCGISLRGCLDLCYLYVSRQDKEEEQRGLGLARLSPQVLGVPIAKDLSIVCYDWASLPHVGLNLANFVHKVRLYPLRYHKLLFILILL